MTLEEAISQLDWHFREYGSVSDEAAYEFLKAEYTKLKKIHERVYCPMRTGENYCCIPMDMSCADIEDKICNGLRRAYNSSGINISTTTTSWCKHD